MVQRQVVRKATIELASDDVNAAFLKAAHLISEAEGEYVEQSSISGSGVEAAANLTLRVSARRLSDVLNELRKLGDVRSEHGEGRDVTGQVVDVEARLRNERRIETELLELLDKRPDAPLTEILELRETLGEIRQRIEELTTRREQLDRLVSLATILVIIRATDATARSSIEGIGAYLTDSLAGAWRAGLVFLVDTVAVVFRVLIGGLVWWVLLVTIVVLARQHRRRARSRA
ncbi:MAG: DUF4349 domain-containing protein [Phycisphaerae bacterium]